MSRHSALLSISLALCILILLDAYLAPVKYKKQVITAIDSYALPSKLKSNYTYIISAKNDKYEIPSEAFYTLGLGDTILIQSSGISRAPFQLTELSYHRTYLVGFAKKGTNLIFILITITGIILFMAFSERIERTYTKLNLFYLLLLLPFAFLLFHLEVHFVIE